MYVYVLCVNRCAAECMSSSVWQIGECGSSRGAENGCLLLCWFKWVDEGGGGSVRGSVLCKLNSVVCM